MWVAVYNPKGSIQAHPQAQLQVLGLGPGSGLGCLPQAGQK